MPKFYGKVGYMTYKETAPGIYDEIINERMYYGDVIKNARGLQNVNQVNDNVTISFEISIVSDPYANENFHAIRYVEFMGTKWKVININVLYPRLVLTVGGIYNE